MQQTATNLVGGLNFRLKRRYNYAAVSVGRGSGHSVAGFSPLASRWDTHTVWPEIQVRAGKGLYLN